MPNHMSGPLKRAPGILVLAQLSLLTLSCAAPGRISRTFPASGISKVVLRASAAEGATLSNTETSPPSVSISGECEGGAKGYHATGPNWRETSATEWGLDFVAKQSGPTLVISSRNEIGYIHHHYTLEQIHVTLPSGVQLVREARELGGDGAPNLRNP